MKITGGDLSCMNVGFLGIQVVIFYFCTILCYIELGCWFSTWI